MMITRNSIFFTILVGLFGLSACNETKPKEKTETKAPQSIADSHSSKNALDWVGIYQGILPCADCEGIETKVVLSEDGSYKRTTKYLGKSEKPFYSSGKFTWNDKGSIINLSLDNDELQQYQVVENMLFHLDKEGNRINGDLENKYKLMKNHADSNLENKKWILKELMGQVQEIDDSKKSIYMIFDSQKGILSGSNGCNRFSGSYELKQGNRFSTGPFANTLLACDDMETANLFINTLEKADNYTIVNGVLNINKGRMATMAKFELDKK